MLPSIERNQEQVKKEVLKPIIFLDLFDYPPTAFEIWRYLDEKISLFHILNSLDELLEKKIIQNKDGFYFLYHRQEIVAIRQERYNYSCRKLKIARHFSLMFSWFFGVRAVTVANYIGHHNLRQGSDIDFFIITKPNTIWLSRLYCAGLAKLLNRRPTKNNKKDKICLSFYISEDSLDLTPLVLDGFDPYFYYWQRGLVNLKNKGKTWHNFLLANQLIVNNQISSSMIKRQDKEDKYKIVEIIIRAMENIAKKIQLKIMDPELSAAANNSDGVFISDQTLKFYLRDRRRYFADIFKLKINEIFKTLN